MNITAKEANKITKNAIWNTLLQQLSLNSTSFHSCGWLQKNSLSYRVKFIAKETSLILPNKLNNTRCIKNTFSGISVMLSLRMCEATHILPLCMYSVINN